MTVFTTKAVIYDMDGVLIDSEPIWKKYEQQVLAEYGIDVSIIHKKYHLVTTGIRINEAIELYSKIVPEKKIDVNQIAHRIVDLVIEKITADKPIMHGVLASLELCQSLGFKIGLASSSPMRLIEAVTDCFNITAYFNQRVSAQQLQYGKPHPEVYLIAAQQLKEDPLNCLTIEDSVVGMIATKAAKMKSIVIPEHNAFDNHHWCLADVKLASLLELNAKHLA